MVILPKILQKYKENSFVNNLLRSTASSGLGNLVQKTALSHFSVKTVYHVLSMFIFVSLLILLFS